MVKYLLSGLAGAASIAATGYGYVHNKDVLIESQREEIARYQGREERLLTAAGHVQMAAEELGKALVLEEPARVSVDTAKRPPQ